MRIDYSEAIAQVGVLETLAAFDPHVAGTPPLGLDLPGTDIDILCHAPDPDAFEAALDGLAPYADFAVRRWSNGTTVVARFAAHG
jgi:hypothetical protein